MPIGGLSCSPLRHWLCWALHLWEAERALVGPQAGWEGLEQAPQMAWPPRGVTGAAPFSLAGPDWTPAGRVLAEMWG